MNRQDVLDAYTVDSFGIIQSPGKFESEMVYVPAFWDTVMDGSAETLDWPDGTTSYVIEIDDSDRSEFPELPPHCVAVHMEESETGFVSCETLTQTDLDSLQSANDSAWESEGESDGDED